jgi:TorA maturation chaperone TorD
VSALMTDGPWQPLEFAGTLAPEDQARANHYGLIARLFYSPPDEQLLAQLLSAPSADGDGERSARGAQFVAAWRALLEGCRSAFPVMLEQEHMALFVGTGKAEVTPYLSHYVVRHALDSPLVELRAQLAAWGLARRQDAGEPEDHISGVCDIMRFAIAVQKRPLEEQKAFFHRFLYRGAIGFCDAVTASEKASFYKLVACLARAFFEVEREAFEIA